MSFCDMLYRPLMQCSRRSLLHGSRPRLDLKQPTATVLAVVYRVTMGLCTYVVRQRFTRCLDQTTLPNTMALRHASSRAQSGYEVEHRSCCKAFCSRPIRSARRLIFVKSLPSDGSDSAHSAAGRRASLLGIGGVLLSLSAAAAVAGRYSRCMPCACRSAMHATCSQSI